MKFSNCIIEAIKHWKADEWRGTLNIRVSRCGTMIHVYYQRFDGVIENFLPMPTAKRKRFAPPLFHGVNINHDVAFKCHVQLREWGVNEDVLRGLSDDEVIEMYESVKQEMSVMGGDF